MTTTITFQMKQLPILLFLALTLLYSSCRKSPDEQAAPLMQTIETHYAAKQYKQVLAGIDSLRKQFPLAIQTRKNALRLYQTTELILVQTDLAATDSALQQTEAAVRRLEQEVNRLRTAGMASPHILHLLTTTRICRDSLQTRFDIQCAKIKYIHKRQKEKL